MTIDHPDDDDDNDDYDEDSCKIWQYNFLCTVWLFNISMALFFSFSSFLSLWLFFLFGSFFFSFGSFFFRLALFFSFGSFFPFGSFLSLWLFLMTCQRHVSPDRGEVWLQGGWGGQPLPLFPKLIGTSKLRNRDPIGTQMTNLNPSPKHQINDIWFIVYFHKITHVQHCWYRYMYLGSNNECSIWHTWWFQEIFSPFWYFSHSSRSIVDNYILSR